MGASRTQKQHAHAYVRTVAVCIPTGYVMNTTGAYHHTQPRADGVKRVRVCSSAGEVRVIWQEGDDLVAAVWDRLFEAVSNIKLNTTRISWIVDLDTLPVEQRIAARTLIEVIAYELDIDLWPHNQTLPGVVAEYQQLRLLKREAEMDGLLWHDSSGKPLEQVVRAAVQRARERLSGVEPGLVLVHPQAINGEPVMVDGLRVLPSPYVLLHHVFVCRGEVSEPKQLRLGGVA